MLPSVELDDLPVVVKFILQSVGDNDAFEVRCMNIAKCAIEIKKKTFFLIFSRLYFFCSDWRFVCLMQENLVSNELVSVKLSRL